MNSDKLIIRNDNQKLDVVFSKIIDIEQNRRVHISLLTTYFNGKINIVDLNGNQYPSKFQNIGIGTLLVNTAILELRKMYNGETILYGNLSNIGDPIEKDLAKTCSNRRKYFWTSFGFKLLDDNIQFKAKLKDLKIKNSKYNIDTKKKEI